MQPTNIKIKVNETENNISLRHTGTIDTVRELIVPATIHLCNESSIAFKILKYKYYQK